MSSKHYGIIDSKRKYHCYDCNKELTGLRVTVGYHGFVKRYCVDCIERFLNGHNSSSISHGVRDANKIMFDCNGGSFKGDKYIKPIKVSFGTERVLAMVKQARGGELIDRWYVEE